MYKLLMTGVVLGALSISAIASSLCEPHYYTQRPPEIKNPALAKKSTALCFSGYAVMHSGVSKTPLWSAEHLTREHLAVRVERKNSFHAEPQLKSGERAELSDYSKSGYDRGHMAPSADMFDETSQYESFSLANMIPQNSENNQILWAGLEASVRNEAMKRGQLYVITGPMFVGSNIKSIGSNQVLVPTHIFKLVYDPAANTAGVYLVENKDTDKWTVISVSQLEQSTKVNFLPSVPSNVKDQVMLLPGPTKIEFSNSNKNKDSFINTMKQFKKSF